MARATGSGPKSRLTIGWIPYWNLVPLGKELRAHCSGGIELVPGPPTLVNRLLRDREVVVAPSSSICLFGSDALEMALPLGVVGRGSVQSVYLGLQVEHREFAAELQERREAARGWGRPILTQYAENPRGAAKAMLAASRHERSPYRPALPPLRVTAASASSAALARILFGLWLGGEVFGELTKPDTRLRAPGVRPVELLIGDEALVRRPQFWRVIDLSSAWFELTGMPFVFAVWQSRRPLPAPWRRWLMEMGELAEAKMHSQPQGYVPNIAPRDTSGREINLCHYWRGITYRLGAEELRSLMLFLCLFRELRNTPLDSAAIVKLTRWQEASRHLAAPSL